MNLNTISVNNSPTNIDANLPLGEYIIDSRCNWREIGLDKTTGAITSTSVSLTLWQIPVFNNIHLYAEQRRDNLQWCYLFCFYDSSKVFIKYDGWNFVNSSNKNIFVPQNARYFSFSCCLNNGSSDIKITLDDFTNGNFKITYCSLLQNLNSKLDLNTINYSRASFDLDGPYYFYENEVNKTRIVTVFENLNYDNIQVTLNDDYFISILTLTEKSNSIYVLNSDASTMIVDTPYDLHYRNKTFMKIPRNCKSILILFRKISNGDITENDIKNNVSIEFNVNEYDYINYSLLKNERSYYKSDNINEIFTLLHFSDIHEDLPALHSVINYSKEHPDLDDVICTGDHHRGYWTEDYELWKWANAGFILDCIGNHDTGNAPNRQAIYNRFIAPHVNEWNVVQPANASTNYLNYYYKDYDKTMSKIRLIVLDCMNYDNDLNTWFISVLDEARTSNRSVIVAEHYQGGLPLNDINTEMNDADLLGYLGGSSGDMEKADDRAVNAVSSFIDNGGEFVCWITGHTHDSRFTHIQEDSRQLCIVASSQASSSSAVCKAYNRDAFGANYDMFNVYSVDTTNKLIKVLRVGANKNILFRGCRTLCYDYVNNRILGED